MNFEPTSDAELASATFDNEVAGDERIHALADPAVVAEIASYQLVRDALNDVVVPATARASSIAAALAAFDELCEDLQKAIR